jgi:hypothetical protein
MSARCAFIFLLLLLSFYTSFVSDARAGFIIKQPAYLGLAGGLVGYWSFDGSHIVGTRAYDASGNNNQGTLTNGPRRAIGKLGQALEFNKLNDRVDTISFFDDTDDFSFSLWARPNKTSSTETGQFIIGQRGTSITTMDWDFYCSNSTSNYELYLGENQASGSLFDIPCTFDTWSHVAVAKSGSVYTLYVDGVQKSQVTNTTTWTKSEVLRIANHSAAIGAPFRGLIDETRIYNRALSGEEIKRLYNQGATKVNKTPVDALKQGLVGYWTFDGSHIVGTRAYDASGNNNQGTLTNGPKRAIGKLGQALEFDGVDDYVVDTSVSQISLPVTITSWFYLKSTITTGGRIILAHSTTANNGFSLALVTSGGLLYPDFTFGGVADYTCTNLSAINPNQWYFVAATATGNSGTATCYLGEVSGSFTSETKSIGTMSGTPDRISIGTRGDLANFFPSGLIDEVRIYNRILPTEEIKRLYNQGATKLNKTPVDALTQGLVGYWTFDGSHIVGTRAYDASGNNNQGTLTNGPKRAVGKLGQALDFDGSNDYVDAGNITTLNGVSALSVSAWVKTDTLEGGDSNLRDITAKNGVGAAVTTHILRLDTSVDLFEFYAAGAAFVQARATTPVQTNTWYHIVGTYDGAFVRIYINGVEEKATAKTGATGDTSEPLRIGNSSLSSNTRHWDGSIDEFRIYNRALSAEEVKRLYQIGR